MQESCDINADDASSMGNINILIQLKNNKCKCIQTQ